MHNLFFFVPNELCHKIRDILQILPIVKIHLKPILRLPLKKMGYNLDLFFFLFFSSSYCGLSIPKVIYITDQHECSRITSSERMGGEALLY